VKSQRDGSLFRRVPTCLSVLADRLEWVLNAFLGNEGEAKRNRPLLFYPDFG